MGKYQMFLVDDNAGRWLAITDGTHWRYCDTDSNGCIGDGVDLYAEKTDEYGYDVPCELGEIAAAIRAAITEGRLYSAEDFFEESAGEELAGYEGASIEDVAGTHFETKFEEV